MRVYIQHNRIFSKFTIGVFSWMRDTVLIRIRKLQWWWPTKPGQDSQIWATLRIKLSFHITVMLVCIYITNVSIKMRLVFKGYAIYLTKKHMCCCIKRQTILGSVLWLLHFRLKLHRIYSQMLHTKINCDFYWNSRRIWISAWSSSDMIHRCVKVFTC